MTSPLDPVLSMVIADASDGFVVIAGKREGENGMQSLAFPIAEAQAAQAYALALSLTHHVWVESALQQLAPPPGKRGTEAGASQFSLVSLDFDGAWGIHKEKQLPPSPDDLPRLLEAAGAPVPSIVLSTGGGLLALWQLHAALPIPHSEQESRARAKSASTAFQRRIREVASRRFGWKLDGTADLCRLIRIPGTLNHKFDPPRSVVVMA